MPKKPASGPLIGYARVSTQGQDLAQQRAALRGAGCNRVFEEKVSGAKRDRPQLERLLDHLRGGDVVAVTRLDRLARSTRDLLEIAERIKDAGAGLRSMAEPWADTTTPAGRMALTVFAGIADFERSLIVERTERGPCRCEGTRHTSRAAPVTRGRANCPRSPTHPASRQTRGRGCQTSRRPSFDPLSGSRCCPGLITLNRPSDRNGAW